MFLRPYENDAEQLVPEYLTYCAGINRVVQRTPEGQVDYEGRDFRIWYRNQPKERNLRLATRQPDALVAYMAKQMAEWESLPNKGICSVTGVPLLNQKWRITHSQTAGLAKNGYLTDPFDTEDMYYIDSLGKQRCLRGTSQPESRHRFTAEDMPGTNMSVIGAHRSFICSTFRFLVHIRPLTRGTHYRNYKTLRHEALANANAAFTAAGMPEPYPLITRPAPGITRTCMLAGARRSQRVQPQLQSVAAAQPLRLQRQQQQHAAVTAGESLVRLQQQQQEAAVALLTTLGRQQAVGAVGPTLGQQQQLH